jgi:hypothetical protein
MDTMFGIWNVRSRYREDSLKTEGSEVAKYNLDSVAVQVVKCVEGGSHPADDYTFFYGNGKAYRVLGTDFFVHRGITSAVETVENVSNRI